MSDTPQHIKEKQLELWLSKTPAERLKQTLADNEALFLFWKTITDMSLSELKTESPRSV
jgi:hypothetical protein